MNIKKIAENYLKSNIERARVRPYWKDDEKVINYYFFWEVDKGSIKNKDFEIQRHKVFNELLRLIYLPEKRLIGYGFEKDFLIKELYPLYSLKNGFVNTDIEVKTIAHISDLHILWKLNETKEGNYYSDKLLHYLVLSLKNENPDLIVVTGDITDDGLGYIKFYNAFKDFIKKGRVLIVPGNHDLNPLGVTVFAEGFKRRDFKEFARIIMGKGSYIDNFIFEFKNLMIIGANSSDGINKNITDNAVGYVNFKKFDSYPENYKNKIFLLHHHLEYSKLNIMEEFIKLRNASEVIEFCKRYRVNLLLHGHKHISYEKFSGKIKNMQIFGAPSTMFSRKYHIITYNGGIFNRKEIKF